ncbi:MAG: hypothetical protein SW833_11620 [Cyanobacteriota bacterium]|nr:hypothetical protein [Cyanobacteriota bacterium]
MTPYLEVYRLAEQLSPHEQLQLIHELLGQMRDRVVVTAKPKRSILELEGLGKEIWSDVDARDYINGERESWNG